MIALCFLLGGVLAGSLVVNAWLTYRAITGTEREAKSELGALHFESALELAHFELEHTRDALAAANARADALEGIIADEINEAPNPDLGRTDVRNRVLRVAKAWATADKDRVRAESGEGVPAEGRPAGGADPAGVRAVDAPDVQ